MKPRYQTKFGTDGDCFEACVASVFDLDVDEVPDFGKGKDWWDNFITFLTPFGICPLDVEINPAWTTDDILKWMQQNVGEDTMHLISGKSPRGLNHAVVGRGGEIIHDPHPDGGGVAGTLTFTFFVLPDPSKEYNHRDKE